MRFKYVHRTLTFDRFNGQCIKIDGKLYDIDIFPFIADDPDSRMWIRARRVYDCKLYSSEKYMEGFSYDDKNVEKVLFEIKRRIFEDLLDLGYARPVEEFEVTNLN